MSKATHSVSKNAQSSKAGKSAKSRSGNVEYEKFMKEREDLVATLEKETRDGQKRVETTCKNISHANLQSLDKAIEVAEMHFQTALPGTALDFSKTRSEFEAILTGLGQQMHMRERDMNHEDTKVAASELERLFTKRSEDLRNWQQSLKAEQDQEIEKHVRNASREDMIDTTIKFARAILDIPLTAFEQNLVGDERKA